MATEAVLVVGKFIKVWPKLKDQTEPVDRFGQSVDQWAPPAAILLLFKLWSTESGLDATGGNQVDQIWHPVDWNEEMAD